MNSGMIWVNGLYVDMLMFAEILLFGKLVG